MGQSDDLTGISFSLWRFQRYHLCRHTAHLTRPHLTDEQQMVALLEALRSCPDDVFLSRVQFVGAFEPETVQPGAKLKKAGEYGIDVFVDPHQDVWSRWTGGDGAPGWTLDVIGMDVSKLHLTSAAISHQTHGSGAN